MLFVTDATVCKAGPTTADWRNDEGVDERSDDDEAFGVRVADEFAPPPKSINCALMHFGDIVISSMLLVLGRRPSMNGPI